MNIKKNYMCTYICILLCMYVHMQTITALLYICLTEFFFLFEVGVLTLCYKETNKLQLFKFSNKFLILFI